MDNPFMTSSLAASQQASKDRHHLNLPDRPPPIITAQYEGRCSGCNEWINEGDRLQSDDQGGWLGECCLEDA